MNLKRMLDQAEEIVERAFDDANIVLPLRDLDKQRFEVRRSKIRKRVGKTVRRETKETEDRLVLYALSSKSNQSTYLM